MFVIFGSVCSTVVSQQKGPWFEYRLNLEAILWRVLQFTPQSKKHAAQVNLTVPYKLPTFWPHDPTKVERLGEWMVTCYTWTNELCLNMYI